MYATIDDVKLIVWTQYSDEKITAMLDYTESAITNIVWDITYSVKSEKIKNCKAYDKSIFFNNIQIHNILRVNWKDYTDKYEIVPPQRRQVVFSGLFNYVDWTIGWNWYFIIEYLSGYKEIPKDLKLAQVLLVQDMLTNGMGKEVSKYKMWPRSVEYAIWQVSWWQKEVDKILNRYRLFRI